MDHHWNNFSDFISDRRADLFVELSDRHKDADHKAAQADLGHWVAPDFYFDHALLHLLIKKQK